MDFTNFDPSKSKGNSQTDKPILPVGIYVLAAKMFKRKEKNGKESIMFVMVPLFSPRGGIVGKNDYSAVFETCTLTAEAAWRLSALCQAVGRNEPFNVMSDGEVCGVFVRQPFKARVIHDTYQGRVSAKIKEYFEITEAEVKKAEVVLENWDIDGDADGGGSYEPEPQGLGNGITDGSSDFTDDDIPF